MNMIAHGQVGRAAARITSPGVAPANSPTVQATLKSKFVQRVRQLPSQVTKGQSVDQLNLLREALLDLEKGKAAGPGGMRPEFLVVLGEVLSEGDIDRLEQHSLRCLNGSYPPWFHSCLGVVTTVPLYKPGQRENTSLRPLGISPCFVRCIERVSTRQNRQVLQSYLEPQQQAMSVGVTRLYARRMARV